MIASSVLNSITFKNITGDFPNMWNTLHINRMQGQNKVIPYYQKFQKDHVVYLQFESDNSADITLKSFYGKTEVETITNSYSSHYGTTNNRYYTNFAINLDSDYYNKTINFEATQGELKLISEPIFIADLTDQIRKGTVKYIKLTNLDRIESDLDDRFIDWSIIPTDGNCIDFFIEATDIEPNDTDESEVLEGSQSMTILSAAYYSGKVLKTGPIPDYLIARLGMASSLDVFLVNGVQYIKKGEIDVERFGTSTLYQSSIKLIQKNAIGINVDNFGASEEIVVPVPAEGQYMYIGSVSSATPTEAEIKLMTAKDIAKENQTFHYTGNAIHPCFAFPSSFGSLASILDGTGDEIISGFVRTTANFTFGSTVVNYTIYTLIPASYVTDFIVIYKFTTSVITPVLTPPVAIGAAYVLSSSFEARWQSVFSATGYYLTVLYASNRGPIAGSGYNDFNVGNVTSYSVTGLDLEVEYIYLVKAYNDDIISDYSNEISVTTT